MPLVLLTSVELSDSDYVYLVAQQTAERREEGIRLAVVLKNSCVVPGTVFVTSGSEGDSLCSSCLTVCSEREPSSSNLKMTVCCKWSS